MMVRKRFSLYAFGTTERKIEIEDCNLHSCRSHPSLVKTLLNGGERVIHRLEITRKLT